jgi:hypothetical protein
MQFSAIVVACLSSLVAVASAHGLVIKLHGAEIGIDIPGIKGDEQPPR